MIIYLGADHGGFELKEKLKSFLTEKGYVVEDCGAHSYDKDDDYPDFAKVVAEKVAAGPDRLGILICRSGAGVDIVANKVKGILSALIFTAEQAKMVREHEGANVLTLASDFTSEETAKSIVVMWLETPFSGAERHLRRLEKIRALEH